VTKSNKKKESKDRKKINIVSLVVGITGVVMILASISLLVFLPKEVPTEFVPVATGTAVPTAVATEVIVDVVEVEVDPIQGNIPDAIYTYPCFESVSSECVEEGDPLSKIVTHVLWAEGGSVSNQASVDVLQVIHNRMFNAWTCSIWANPCPNAEWQKLNPDKIPWAMINEATFEKLALYILSQPYMGVDGIQYAALNGWHIAINTAALEYERSPLLNHMYKNQTIMVENWIKNGRGASIEEAGIELVDTTTTGYTHTYQPQMAIRDSRILYFYATKNHWAEMKRVAYDYVDDGSGNRLIIQFTYISGYNEDAPDMINP
jgi:hypothetical protein